MAYRIPLICGLAAICLGACANRPEPLTIDYDPPEPFIEAVPSSEPPRPVEIVTVPEPLPLPGQLRPLPALVEIEAETLPPVERAAGAHDAARLEPVTDGYINAIQVYPYVQGALYRLYTAPEQVSEIALQPGEQLNSVSAGDTVRWVVGDTTSGAGEAERVHVLIKPIRAGLETNLIITTDRRIYHLELASTRETYMASVSWTYPHDALTALRTRNAQAEVAEARVIDRGLDLERLNFRYAINGDDAPWAPVRAFDDGRKAYIEFPARLDQGDAPPLFLLGAGGEAQLVNYRVRGRYYVVDRLFAAAELRLGEAPQQVVRITRTDARPMGEVRSEGPVQ